MEFKFDHGMPVSRNGDNAENALGTDNLWQTYTVDLEDDLKDYEPNNELIAVNGLTIRGDTLSRLTLNLFRSLGRREKLVPKTRVLNWLIGDCVGDWDLLIGLGPFKKEGVPPGGYFR